MNANVSNGFHGGAEQFDGRLGSRRSGTILVAAHDGAQRRSVTNFLVSRGYGFVLADSAQDVLFHLKSGGIDLVVSAMRDAGGFDLMRQVRQAMPGLPVIMIALGDAELDGVHLDCATGLKREMFGDAQSALTRLASLTARERQVLNLIVGGRANKVIAYELSISPRTVENHRARVMEKLRAKSVAELVRLALGAGEQERARAVKIAAGNDTGASEHERVTA
ncbi:MAG TPA: LuxR C-terminal-related transcriptional regulator [Rhizomicrobium sp.]